MRFWWYFLWNWNIGPLWLQMRPGSKIHLIWPRNVVWLAAPSEPGPPSQYPKRRLFVRSRKVSKPRDWYFKFQSDRTILNTNLAASMLYKILRKDVFSDIETEPGASHTMTVIASHPIRLLPYRLGRWALDKNPSPNAGFYGMEAIWTFNFREGWDAIIYFWWIHRFTMNLAFIQ